MESDVPEKPCLVTTERGFSVSYQNRFLYSKYAPDRAIEGAVSSLQILPNTLILAFSPVLWLGLDSLIKKLPENCFVLGVELDKNLHEFAQSELEKKKSAQHKVFRLSQGTDGALKQDDSMFSRVSLLPFELNGYIVNVLTEGTFPNYAKSRHEDKCADETILPHISNFRRAIPLEMSAGTQFYKDGYLKTAVLAQNAIASFWKNRITLTKMGRLYSRNLFKNLSNLLKYSDIKVLAHMIENPIFVFGAGESIEESFKNIPQCKIEKCFIIAVDAAVAALTAHKIRIDAVVAVEGQLTIEKAYIGGGAKNSLLIADMVSREQVTRHAKNVLYFASKYTDATFFKNLSRQHYFPHLVPPLGSVGLTAVYLALLLRANVSVPVFVSGLDFSFSLGRTHAKNTPAHLSRLFSSGRFNPVENYSAAFKNGAKKITGKNGTEIYTDTILEAYAKSFADAFSNTQNLYDAGKQGIPLNIQEISGEKASAYLDTREEKIAELKATVTEKFPDSARNDIVAFLQTEEKALNRIKELLMFGNDVASCSCSLDDELHSLIAPREYLFLHFPDGYKCGTNDLSFLKRVRSQIDFFLKDIKNCLSQV